MNDLINQARDFAHKAHDAIEQRRKYLNTPYWFHTDEVAETVFSTGATAFAVAAAHLHDYREDVVTELEKQGREVELVFFEREYNAFPVTTRELVNQLTDEYTSENYPNWNRARRKAAEAQRIAGISNEAKTIKLADLLSNTASIVEHDPDFARTYLDEKAAVMRGLVGGNDALYDRVYRQLLDAQQKLIDNALKP